MRTSNATSGQSVDRRAAVLRQMTADQLLDLGTRQFVYLRMGTRNGERLFVLYGADGAPLAMVGDVETVVEVVAEHGLEFVTVH
jgi:hypothetical protein